jgi:hypothetical protein
MKNVEFIAEVIGRGPYRELEISDTVSGSRLSSSSEKLTCCLKDLPLLRVRHSMLK